MITAAAVVSAGIDMGPTLTGLVTSDQVAKAMQLAIEYDLQPPFVCGSVVKADPDPIDLVRTILASQSTDSVAAHTPSGSTWGNPKQRTARHADLGRSGQSSNIATSQRKHWNRTVQRRKQAAAGLSDLAKWQMRQGECQGDVKEMSRRSGHFRYHRGCRTGMLPDQTQEMPCQQRPTWKRVRSIVSRCSR